MKTQIHLLRFWHAVIAGSFLVAWLTADEDTYAMHLFAGWLALIAVAARLAAGMLAPAGSPLRLRRPSLRAGAPLLPWVGAVVLALVGLSAASGAIADGVTWLEDPHEALSQAALWLVAGHIAYVAFHFGGGRKLVRRMAPVALALLLPAVAMAAEPARDKLLSSLAAEARAADPSFAGFSASRGETLYRTKWAKGDERTPACASCHGDDPRQPGRNAKTGRPIDPVAVSANAKRFTDEAEVDKHFTRDCKSVLGRACTPLEKGDYVTFLGGR